MSQSIDTAVHSDSNGNVRIEKEKNFRIPEVNAAAIQEAKGKIST